MRSRRLELIKMLNRRSIISGVASNLLLAHGAFAKMSEDKGGSGASFPKTVELMGNWGDALADPALQILEQMKVSCMAGVTTLPSKVPQKLRVERRFQGPPAIWLHSIETGVAWIRVNFGDRDWSKLSYQFGHELGHVLCNSWQAGSKPATPCQWIEEALVEAFSLRGLTILADTWANRPPFAGDNDFSLSIANYRQATVLGHAKLDTKIGGNRTMAQWFRANRTQIDAEGYLGNFAKTASVEFLRQFEINSSILDSFCALNLWPERSGLQVKPYIEKWRTACKSNNVPQDGPEMLGYLLEL